MEAVWIGPPFKRMVCGAINNKFVVKEEKTWWRGQ